MLIGLAEVALEKFGTLAISISAVRHVTSKRRIWESSLWKQIEIGVWSRDQTRKIRGATQILDERSFSPAVGLLRDELKESFSLPTMRRYVET
jgi:hypothetical protein